MLSDPVISGCYHRINAETLMKRAVSAKAVSAKAVSAPKTWCGRMSGNPVFRGTRVPVHMLAELVPSRACARTRYRRGSVWLCASREPALDMLED
jgi:hypothetical protein